MAAEAFLRGGAGISRTEALELVNKVRMRAYHNDESGKISDSDFSLDFILDERDVNFILNPSEELTSCVLTSLLQILTSGNGKVVS